MALVVEDGTGLEAAEAYRSVADIATYAAARGLSFPTGDTAAAEAAARRAATWMDATYRGRLPGERVRGRSQGLAWPRVGARDADGEEIASDSVPREWLDAFSEVAVRELASPGSLSPDVTVGRVKRSVSIAGAVSVTYADEGGVVAGERPVLTLVDDLLSGLLLVGVSGGASTYFVGRA